jgi:hypothetical protein
MTAFPQVLAEMDRNLRWTTELGNAYYNQPQEIFAAVQVMGQRAQAAGNLQHSAGSSERRPGQHPAGTGESADRLCSSL